MGMLISGIAACETIDSSGEILKIDGLDISSLERDGVLNVEHESKSMSNIVGKILKAKKIFSDQDCVNESQKKYWKMVQTPYLWILGELFDDVGHSEAQNIVAMLKYDMKAKAEGKYTEDMAQLINLSVEGAKLKKDGNVVSRSIARKISITITPCNKVAQAEAHQADAAKTVSKKNGKLPSDLSIFKSETFSLPQADVDMNLNKADHLKLVKPSEPIGTTSSGKSIGHPQDRLSYHKGFNQQDHKDAHEAHSRAATAAYEQKDYKTHQAHTLAAKFHHQSSQSARPATPKNASVVRGAATTTKVTPSKHTPYGQIGMKKAMTLGGGGGAPSTLAGGAALSKEDLKPKVEVLCKGDKAKLYGSAPTKEALISGIEKFYYGTKVSLHPHKEGHHEVHNSKGKIEGVRVREHKGRWRFESHEEKLSKTEILREYNKQIDASLETWDKVEHFRKFLAERAPNLTKKEAEAFTRVFALYRLKKAEKKLKDF